MTARLLNPVPMVGFALAALAIAGWSLGLGFAPTLAQMLVTG